MKSRLVRSVYVQSHEYLYKNDIEFIISSDDKRIQKYERIRQEYDDLPRDVSLNVEMKIERLITTPLSTIEEEPIGYQDFRMS